MSCKTLVSWITCFLVNVLLIGNSAYANESRAIKVGLSVSSSDERLKNEITSYITREFRALKDVEIVNSSQEIELQVVVVPARTINGTSLGFGISYIVVRPFNKDRLRNMLSEEHKSDPLTGMDSLLYLSDHQLELIPNDRLATSCQSLVANFDTEHLDGIRKFHTMLARSLERREKYQKVLKEVFKDTPQ